MKKLILFIALIIALSANVNLENLSKKPATPSTHSGDGYVEKSVPFNKLPIIGNDAAICIIPIILSFIELKENAPGFNSLNALAKCRSAQHLAKLRGKTITEIAKGNHDNAQ